MFNRINGFAKTGILGYFCGSNALASIAVSTDGGIVVKDTGAVASYAELVRMLDSQDAPTVFEYVQEQGIETVDGSPWDESTLEVQYKASYAAQVNVGRIVDVVRQRATILSPSDVGHELAVTDFITDVNGSLGTIDLASAEVITFLIERANVFDLDVRTFQGVPSTEVQEGRNLLNDLMGVALLGSDGSTEVKLKGTDGTDGNFGYKIFKTIPAVI